jgi:hypothetical protein
VQQQSPQQLQQQHCVVETTPVVRAGRALKGAPQQLQQSPALLMAYFLQLQAVQAPVLVEAQAEAVEVLGVPVLALAPPAVASYSDPSLAAHGRRDRFQVDARPSVCSVVGPCRRTPHAHIRFMPLGTRQAARNGSE